MIIKTYLLHSFNLLKTNIKFQSFDLTNRHGIISPAKGLLWLQASRLARNLHLCFPQSTTNSATHSFSFLNIGYFESERMVVKQVSASVAASIERGTPTTPAEIVAAAAKEAEERRNQKGKKKKDEKVKKGSQLDLSQIKSVSSSKKLGEPSSKFWITWANGKRTKMRAGSAAEQQAWISALKPFVLQNAHLAAGKILSEAYSTGLSAQEKNKYTSNKPVSCLIFGVFFMCIAWPACFGEQPGNSPLIPDGAACPFKALTYHLLALARVTWHWRGRTVQNLR